MGDARKKVGGVVKMVFRWEQSAGWRGKRVGCLDKRVGCLDKCETLGKRCDVHRPVDRAAG